MSTDSFTPTLEEAIKSTSTLRERMNKGDWPFEKIKGYYLSKESIQKMLEQNGGKTSGLKIYFGESTGGDKPALEVIVVATIADDKQQDDDFDIPPVGQSIPSAGTAVLGATRPCPDWCGKNNVLNQP